MDPNMQEQQQQQEVDVPGTPKRKDRLFTRLSHGFTHASQVVPSYGEFCLGHGDPLRKAVLDYERLQALPGTPKTSHKKLSHKTFDVYVDKEVHLKQHGSPLGGMGMNDVVHINETTALEFPCIRLFDQLEIEAQKE